MLDKCFVDQTYLSIIQRFNSEGLQIWSNISIYIKYKNNDTFLVE